MNAISPTGNSIAAQTAANILSGERTHSQFTHPLTGDAEVDFILLVLLGMQNLNIHPSEAACACDYLARRFRDKAAAMDKFQQSYRGVGSPPGYEPEKYPQQPQWTPVPPDIAALTQQIRAMQGNSNP